MYILVLSRRVDAIESGSKNPHTRTDFVSMDCTDQSTSGVELSSSLSQISSTTSWVVVETLLSVADLTPPIKKAVCGVTQLA